MTRPSLVHCWIVACRPRTLWASIAPVLLGASMAFARGSFHPGVALLILATALLIQIGTNFANDLFDFEKGADTEERRGPLRVVQAGLVTPRAMRRAIAVVLAGAFLIGCYLALLGGLPIVVIGTLSLLFALAYTGGPYPLAYTGVADIFVLLFFGPIAVGGAFYLLTGTIDGTTVAAGLSPGMISTAILTVNNIRDREGDARAGKKTLAVRFGDRPARAYYAALIIGALLTPVALVLAGLGPTLLWSVFSVIPALRPLETVLRSTKPEELTGALEGTGKLLAIHSLLFSVGWILSGTVS